MRGEDPDGPDEELRHANRFGGTGGDVVQARDVQGGVHFHGYVPAFAVTPRQLPGGVRGFVNRHAELARLDDIAADHREPSVSAVAVITGTAGVGKTSLALHWAHGARQRFSAGELYVNLRGYDPGPPATPEQVLDRFLRDLGVPTAAIPAGLEDRASLYRSILADRRMLIVLDNAASASQVRPLLPGTPGSLVLVTSRSRLSGLVAREGAYRLGVGMLLEADAVALLRAVTTGYRGEDQPHELRELAGLCARLPLALRIAAERAASRPLMMLGELIADLRDESALWNALSAEDDEETDAVRTVFAWSYRALPEQEARLFRFLGVHPGNDFSLPAAAAVVGITPAQARQQLDVLVGAHLMEQSAPGRYRFHDLLRAYAVDQLHHLESGDARIEALRRVLGWYLHTADAAQLVLSPFDGYPLDQRVPADVAPLAFDGYEPAYRWYQTESVNLVAATRIAAAAGLHSTAWRLSAVLRGIYMHQNAFDDWVVTARVGVDAAAQAGDRPGEAEALESLGKAYFQSLRLYEAEEAHRAALVIRREIGDRFGEAVSVNALGLLGLRHRRLDEAESRFEQSTAIFRELGDRRWVALLQANLAEAHCELAEYEAAVSGLGVALGVFRDLGDRSCEGNALFLLSWARRELGRTGDARASIDEALTIASEEENPVWQAHWLVELAKVQRTAGQPGEALNSYQRAASIQRKLGDRSREAAALDGTGEAYQELGRFAEAANFHRQAAATHRQFGDRWQLAVALHHLAMALDRTDASEQARAHREEALVLLEAFDDPKAVSLARRVSEGLRTP
ncbi:tetratricopeptide repeat protein [Actinomadura sp. DC4]|uniref:ATP-binding protein n=1 Tax=Actinomadura sp. DC4 TaxID=3055069 RepID=UPI0025B10B2C|nr:tetratricopeptide repeat protein [Actinomadura sp. DC4]MDN3358373.1 tetratricopeptide repeat protein [Actinomadura sp. DC4]